jgi:hypothetical protein
MEPNLMVQFNPDLDARNRVRNCGDFNPNYEKAGALVLFPNYLQI